MAIKKDQIKTIAATYTTEPEQARKPAKEKKTPISFYIRPSIYEELKRLARYQGTTAGTLMDTVIADYLDQHREELREYDRFMARMQQKHGNGGNDIDS